MKHFLIRATEYAMGTNCPYVWDTYYTPKKILKMTAKEKAEQLINEYLHLSLHIDFYTAKQCAIITVRNILKTINEMDSRSYIYQTQDLETIDKKQFWLDVYDELNKDL